MLATLMVTSGEDAGDADPGDGICEISSGGPCTLRAAIQEANALAGADQIELPAGTYRLSLEGSDEQLAQTGDLDINGDLSIQGAGSAASIIDGGGIDRVFDVVNGTVTIGGVTIQGGLIADDDGTVESLGGGIRNEGNLTLVDSVVSGNASPVGAGIANYNASLQISRSVISANGNASTRRGGGVSHDANYDPANMEIRDTTITGNRADLGGGISQYSYDGTATASIERSTISGNTANDGGGISNRSVAYYYDDVSSNLTIRSSTISGNTADNSGGGVHNEAEGGSIASVGLSNSTIAFNEAYLGDGGGLFNAATATATMHSVIVAGNSADGTGPDLAGELAEVSFSLIQDETGHSIFSGTNGNIVGEDPLLGPLADNGGPTSTHTLLEGSPAIDQGANPDVLTSDQRGSAFLRTIDDDSISDANDGTDIGAIEIGQQIAVHDFGDAADGIVVGGIARAYPTTLANDGARHLVSETGPRLGSVVPDVEQNGQPTAAADGDDQSGIDDESAINATTIELTPGQPLSGLNVSHHGGSSGAVLSGWLDLNLDGDWDDPGEQILTDVAVPAGASTTSLANVVLPPETPVGTSFLRLRISTQSGLSTRGEATDGEVEDFVASISAPQLDADLSLTAAVDDANPTLGQDATFSFTVSNQGPGRATNIEVGDFLPFELLFVGSSVTQGQYDDLDGIWFVGDLDPGAEATLSVTATVDSTDSIRYTAEVIAADQLDPDSTPDNDNEAEDDQATAIIGTCLSSELVDSNLVRLSYGCATPGALTAFVRGSQRGTQSFPAYSTNVDIADAEEFAIGIADVHGVSVALLELTDADLDQTLLVQAFEMVPGTGKSNTLSVDPIGLMLHAGSEGAGGESLTDIDFTPLVDAAVSGWLDAGMRESDAMLMRQPSIVIGDLPGSAIGRVWGGVITLDHNAAGHGWFVDATPHASEEFAPVAGSSSLTATGLFDRNRIDLLTTLMHELGHLAGLPDVSNPDSVMHATLETGIRRYPASNTNQRDPHDVNDDQVVSALDALLVINQLSQSGGQDVWIGKDGGEHNYLDANGDFRVSALDALMIINQLGRQRELVPSAELIAPSPFAPDADDKHDAAAEQMMIDTAWSLFGRSSS